MGVSEDTVGSRIVALRAELGLSQVGLAAEVHVHPVTIWRIENGRVKPTMEVLQRIAEVGGVPVSALLPGDDTFFEGG